ncbi:P-loop containing nucleoside triphosphate hydrolase protein [Lentinus tigrinus ALCF2SS1-6]|uniref:P-loop containing nucleoside triphosphate hydrolase protein n=1 Tax=Lentinus tigrinus ALCF2SS1-6 TaxID=1328759 RepID=A0A5C2T6P3_9APHY|nr:P-loop containing nucleoside triphosphate hydrolase protein [Lentinus tigrinus ALCF2SS1-6]
MNMLVFAAEVLNTTQRLWSSDVPSWVPNTTLALPAGAATVSLFVLLTRIVMHFAQPIRAKLAGYETPRDYPAKTERTPASRERRALLKFQLSRLTLCALLLVLSVVTAVTGKAEGEALLLDLSLIGVYVYTTGISLASVILHDPLNASLEVHVTLVSLTVWSVFAYRDIWPLATYHLVPEDASEGWILWLKVFALTLVGVVIPLVTPRRRVLIGKEEGEPNPEQTASPLSLVTYGFMEKFVWDSSKMAHCPFDKLPPLADYDRIDYLVEGSFQILDPFVSKTPKGLLSGILYVFRWDYLSISTAYMIRFAARFSSPIGIYQLLKYMETGGAGATIRPWVWIIWLSLGPLISQGAFSFYQFLAARVWVQAAAMLTQLVYNHALRVRVKADVDSGQTEGPPKGSKNLSGKLFTLATSDVANLLEGREFLQILFAPFWILACIYFLYALLGWSAFVGLGVMICLWPVPGYFLAWMQKIQRERMKMTDARVQEISETVTVIRMIKMFAWEERTANKIDVKRQNELKRIVSFKIAQVLGANVHYIIPLIVMISTFFTYTAIMKKELTASRVYSVVSVFSALRVNMAACMRLFPLMVQAKVSLDRLSEFLQQTELTDEYASGTRVATREDVIGIRATTFAWSNENHESSAATTTSAFKLRIDELMFEQGSVNLVVGPTGSGKTALLLALLGEMHAIPEGTESYIGLPRSRGVAYVPQESWILSDTIKANILFGSPYDEARYQQVLYQCALEHDLSLFDYGDETEVGERGLTLSGGQKARVSLARAVYSSAETLLLDDIFAALDVHTARWIVEKCLKGELLRGRTVILVTHNVAVVEGIASYVVSLGQDGRIANQGQWSRVLQENAALSKELDVGREEFAVEIEDASVFADTGSKKPASNGQGKLVAPEEISQGHISRTTVNAYFSDLGGRHPFVFWSTVIVGLLICYFFNVAQTYWLGHWAQQYEDTEQSKVSIPFYLGMYAGIIALDYTFRWSSFIIYLFGMMRACRKIHNSLIASVLHATLRWLDTTPTSRIIARCTQDIQTIDGPLSATIYNLYETTAAILMSLAGIVWVAPIFSAIGIISATLGGWWGQVYLKAQLPVKREMSNTRAPILGHLGATLTGLVTIRAYGAQERFIQESYLKLDNYTRATRTFYTLNRWIAVRLELLSTLFAASVATYLVYGAGGKAATTGFALVETVGFSGLILTWVRLFNEVEVHSNSLERVEQYLHIEHEPAPTPAGTPPAYWPASGSLQVEKLSARYSADGPRVLHDISFEVKSGERVGIVGRTGSGKSSLALSLLRLILTEGQVYYDGILTNSINLDALRSKLTIIPQSPELLSGTLRQNLDPFSEFDDAVLNDALRTSGLFSLQSQEGEARITLDSQISSGGGNLSVGQRQILALARAIARQSKLLILDEATSAIDYETDTVIQRSLREAVSKDTTVLTIAHRLQTIMDADKILVLDSGHVAEFGSPAELLKNKDGIFTALVDESGDRDALRAIVKATDA